jgi:catechol 2,3-dioxygenase-like lactoylglutathione lyase family enzyme
MAHDRSLRSGRASWTRATAGRCSAVQRAALWIGAFGPAGGPVHLAFRAESRAQVRAFHEAALAAGGLDNGAAGLRPNCGPDYYAAFVFDPDGHNVEAVTFAAP